MDQHYFSVKNAQLALMLKNELEQKGVESRILVDPLSSLYPALADNGEICVAIHSDDLLRLDDQSPELKFKVS